MNSPEEAIALHQKAINDRNIDDYKDSGFSFHLSKL